MSAGKSTAEDRELLDALIAFQAAHAMSVYGDYSDFTFPAITPRVPGNSAWGNVCEKHGLGYGGGCICCRDEFERHRDEKDRQARRARDEALDAASRMAAAALSKTRSTS